MRFKQVYRTQNFPSSPRDNKSPVALSLSGTNFFQIAQESMDCDSDSGENKNLQTSQLILSPIANGASKVVCFMNIDTTKAEQRNVLYSI